MIRLNIGAAPEPQWYELFEGVRILAAPATSVVMVIARNQMMAEGINPDTQEAEMQVAFAKAVAEQVVREWEGFDGPDGNPVEVTPEYVRAALDISRVYQSFEAVYLARWMGVAEEKNGSAPSPNGISAAARTTASTAPQSAKRARAKSSGRKQ